MSDIWHGWIKMVQASTLSDGWLLVALITIAVSGYVAGFINGVWATRWRNR